MVCTKCSVVKKLIIEASDDGVVRKPFTVCLECLIMAKNLSPRDLALSEIPN